MYLLYLDESGNENDANDRFFVLAGMALFERQTFFLSRAIDEVQRRHFPDHQLIAFHANEIRSGRKLWRKVPEAKREAVLSDLIQRVLQSPDRGRILFAAAVYIVNVSELATIDKRMLRRRAKTLDTKTMETVDAGLALVLGLKQRAR